jgi:hypothetical protein
VTSVRHSVILGGVHSQELPALASPLQTIDEVQHRHQVAHPTPPYGATVQDGGGPHVDFLGEESTRNIDADHVHSGYAPVDGGDAVLVPAT